MTTKIKAAPAKTTTAKQSPPKHAVSPASRKGAKKAATPPHRRDQRHSARRGTPSAQGAQDQRHAGCGHRAGRRPA